MSTIMEVNSNDFKDKVLNYDNPIVLEFYSHSCPHCQAFNIVYTHLSEVMRSEVKFAKLDVLYNEDNRQLALSRGVRGVPTIEMFYRGRVICSVIGNHSYENIAAILEDALKRKDEGIAPHTLLNELKP